MYPPYKIPRFTFDTIKETAISDVLALSFDFIPFLHVLLNKNIS